jgi:YHS domain-containing protein
MSSLIYFLVWAGLIFVMMRFGCGAHVMGHGHGRHEGHGGDTELRTAKGPWVAPETEIDPVCRKTVRTDGAKSAVYRGAVYYFCSAEHRDAFEADPARYVGSREGAEAKQMEHHHE